MPGHHGSSGTSMGVPQGTTQGPAGGASAGGLYGGNVNPSQTYGGHTVQDQRDYRADPEGFVEKNTHVPEEKKSFWDGVKDTVGEFIEDGGLLGNVVKLGGKVLSKLGEYSSDLQKKAMTYALNNKITSIGKKDDFHPGAYGYKIQDIQKDLDAIERGDFKQSDFNEKYGSPEISVGGGEGGRDAMNMIAPAAPYIVGGSTPQESQAAKWYANLGATQNNGFGFSFANEFAAAKQKQQGILGSPSPVGMLAVNNSPFYNFLKERNLDKGIL